MDSDKAQLRAPTGTRDILPPESARWEMLVSRFARLVSHAGYGLLMTPLFEDTAVFARGVGQQNDVVTKEMYNFHDKAGRSISLRPEVTASVARAFVQHRPQTPWKVWYWGPQFRYERPQAGRYRQFYQMGAEALGTSDPEIDVEVISLAWDYCASLDIPGLALRVNSLGDATCRPVYREALVSYLRSHEHELCSEHKERWQANPLRVLDCKRPDCLAATEGAPHQLDYLCDPCQEHWKAVLEGLLGLGLEVSVDPRLVRGLDYYTRTTFEMSSLGLHSAQDAVGGGGRYDGLVETIGGPPTAGIGFSLGMERLLLAIDSSSPEELVHGPDAFVVDLVGGSEATRLTRELRRAGLSADRAFDARSLRAQMRAADRSRAPTVVIVGGEELASDTVTVRSMRSGDSQDQVRVPRTDLLSELRRRAKATKEGS